MHTNERTKKKQKQSNDGLQHETNAIHASSLFYLLSPSPVASSKKSRQSKVSLKNYVDHCPLRYLFGKNLVIRTGLGID
jgi:hypothetical protein